MKKRRLKIIVCTLIIVILSLILVNSVSADSWYKGDLHIHTGYSSKAGYDSDIDIISDNCPQESLNDDGVTISQLKTDAVTLGIGWLTITDHGYCLNQSEWNTLVNECGASSDGSFLCTVDMELSVNDYQKLEGGRNEF